MTDSRKIKLSDYIAKRLKEHYGVEKFFMVSGGGAMHLNDSLGKYIPYIANHHEQACSMAAEGYARTGQKLAVVNVTTGPGGLNCLNGVFGEWTDSMPVLYISGQVKYTTTLASCPQLGLRQLGDQEVDIITSVKHLTKYAKMVTDPNEIKYHLDKAIFQATHGRHGPVWLDIPMNVQAAIIDESELKEFVAPTEKTPDEAEMKIDEILQKLYAAKRPMIVAGHGLRIAKQTENFLKLLEVLDFPAVTTFNGIDTLATSHKNYVGRIGTSGSRAGNFTLQNSDCVLFLGTRNNIRQVSYNWENFAKNAFKIAVDIDAAELKKPTLAHNIAVNADLADFIPALLKNAKPTKRDEWLTFSKNLHNKYSFENTPEYQQKDGAVNVYNFIKTLTDQMGENDVLVCANGSGCICTYQAATIRGKQRLFYNSGNASMGYDLPAAIGAACAAKENQNVICLTGDGSIMMNLQELQTIKHNKLPIKIFLINNDGYSSIQQTQNHFFEGRKTGCTSESGVSTPDFCAIANAFAIKASRIENGKDLAKKIDEVLADDGASLCEVMAVKDYTFTPKLSAKKLPDGSMQSPTLEDMFPFLDREEFESNILK